MATRDEIRIVQTSNYYQLLTIQALNKKVGKDVEGLQNAISLAKAMMLEPDIAWVEKQVNESNK
ncbi:MAG: hypothetical protein FWD03_03970 [Defluviitaleaceae bacterium]|nr:hypothetical protein [Defluviitaleaceae bacterium]